MNVQSSDLFYLPVDFGSFATHVGNVKLICKETNGERTMIYLYSGDHKYVDISVQEACFRISNVITAFKRLSN